MVINTFPFDMYMGHEDSSPSKKPLQPLVELQDYIFSCKFTFTN